MIVLVQPSDAKREMKREEHLLLGDVSPRLPHRSDAQKIFKRFNTAPVPGKDLTILIDIDAVADIDNVVRGPVRREVLGETHLCTACRRC